MTDAELDRMAERELEAYEAFMNDDTRKLSTRERQFFIAGLIGENERFIHDGHSDDLYTTDNAVLFKLLCNYTDAELIDESDIVGSPYETAEDFYLAHASYCPPNYWVE